MHEFLLREFIEAQITMSVGNKFACFVKKKHTRPTKTSHFHSGINSHNRHDYR